MRSTLELEAHQAIEQLTCALHAYKALPWWTYLFRRGRDRVIKDVTEAYQKGRYITANMILPTALDDELDSLLLETEMTMGWNV